MTDDPVELPDWLADPALLPVWQALHPAISRNHRTVLLKGLSRETRHALSFLLGRPVVGDERVEITDLVTVVRVRAGLTLNEVVLAATGRPLVTRKEEKRRLRAPLERLEQEHPRWLPAAIGLPYMSTDNIEGALAVMRELTRGRRMRSVLAASVLGDAHALDDNKPIGTLVGRMLAIEQGLEPSAFGRDPRRVWADGGAILDSVSTTVLTLGLRPVADDPRAQRLRQAATLGDPVHLSGWEVSRTPLALDPSEPVLVCENPSVLEGFAMQHGATYPVVCTSGWPALVAVDLVSALGAPLVYHGDFDWTGVAICQHLVERCGVVPWRMTSDDYLGAPDGIALSKDRAETPWDPSLAVAMRERGTVVHEEMVLRDLLAAWEPAAVMAHVQAVRDEEKRRVEAQVVRLGR